MLLHRFLLFCLGLLLCACSSVETQQHNHWSDIHETDENGFILGIIAVSVPHTMRTTQINESFSDLGYEVSNIYISQVYARIVEDVINEEQYFELKNHEYIETIDSVRIEFNKERFESLAKNRSEEEVRIIKKNMLKSAEFAGYRISFAEDITREMAEKFSASHPEWEMHLGEQAPNSVIIKTEDGKEQETINELEKLDFVLETQRIKMNIQ